MARRKSYRGTPAEHRGIAAKNLQYAKHYAQGVLRELAQNECRDAVGEFIFMEREFARYKANRDWTGKKHALPFNISNAGPRLLARARSAFINKCIVKKARR
jgi:hypothetical protein